MKFEVDFYTVQFRDDFPEPHPQRFETTIHCRDRGSTFRAILFFTDHAVSAEFSRLESNTAQVYLPANHYPRYIDMLRHEGPVTVEVKNSGKRFLMYTGDERPGEGE